MHYLIYFRTRSEEGALWLVTRGLGLNPDPASVSFSETQTSVLYRIAAWVKWRDVRSQEQAQSSIQGPLVLGRLWMWRALGYFSKKLSGLLKQLFFFQSEEICTEALGTGSYMAPKPWQGDNLFPSLVCLVPQAAFRADGEACIAPSCLPTCVHLKPLKKSTLSWESRSHSCQLSC